MRNIRLTLLALVFGLSACSFSLTSGQSPYADYPHTLAAWHGRGKPARRVVRDAAPTIAKADKRTPPKAEPVVRPEPEPLRVGAVKPPEPLRVGAVKPPKPMRAGAVKPPQPMRAGAVKPPKPMRAGHVDPARMLDRDRDGDVG